MTHQKSRAGNHAYGVHTRNKCFKMEDMKLNTCFAVTLSPPDYRNIVGCGSKMIKGNELETTRQLESHLNDNIQYFKKLKYCKLEIYPELSPTGRLHYHGYIEIKDIVKFYYHDLYLLNEISYEIDTIDPETQKTYIEYITKQQRLMEPIIKEYLGFNYPITIGKGENIQHD